MKRMYLLCMLSLFAVSQAFAGTTGKVAGVIKDAQTGEVLPGANVVVIGTRLGATTDILARTLSSMCRPASWKCRRRWWDMQRSRRPMCA